MSNDKQGEKIKNRPELIKEIEDLQVRLFTDTENETVRVASINISKDVLYNRFNANIDSLVEKAKIVAQKEGIYLGLPMEVIPKSASGKQDYAYLQY